MAYAANHSGSQRTTTLTLVVLFHILVGTVLVATFAPPIMHIFHPPPPPVAFNIPKETPKPAETPKDQSKPTDQSTTSLPPISPLPPLGPIRLVDQPTIPKLDLGTIGGVGGGDTGAIQSFYTPTAPSPASDPGGWASPADYPSTSLRLEEQGVSRFRVTVGTDGTVKACEILRSSGHARLDAATCKFVTQRARFEPATDKWGAKVVGTYTNSVSWRLPN